MSSQASSNPDEFRRIFSQSQKIVAITGAGLSAASGIPTFRIGNGLWQTHDVTRLVTPEAFASNPVLVWRFYHERRRAVLAALPNQAHQALAYTIITQNVDGLSTQAYMDVVSHQSNSTQEPLPVHPKNLLEMHGRLLDTLCTGCGHREHNPADPLCAAFGVDSENIDISVDDLPHCTRCGSLLRPGVVWFDEIPDHLQEIDQIVENADLCLVIGTSSTVYLAAGYADEIAEKGGTVAVFNIEEPEGDADVHFFFPGLARRLYLKCYLDIMSM
ncbi:sirtuin 5 [Paxillus ammoniavirescens]|nr:sirtuin 5 [Paxillus ammoniavirescens]